MKILIIGSPNSIFVKYYIEYVLLPMDAEVYLAGNTNLDTDDRSFYEQRDVKLVDIYKKGIFGRIPKVSTAYYYLKNLKKLLRTENFDYIHIHSLTNRNLLKLGCPIMTQNAGAIISTFWGSDILDIDEKKAKQLEKLMKASKYIVLTTESMKEKFRGYFGNSFDSKIESCYFGNVIIQQSLSTSYDRVNCDKHVVAIGYNGAKRQQHLKVLEQLAKLPKEIKEKLHIVLQMGYGTPDDDYRLEVEKSLIEADMEGTIIDEFLDIKSTIKLRSSVDIFINSQTTDASSSSVLEYIYFGAEVINPTWIEYDVWDKCHVEYHRYQSFVELNDIILDIISGTKSVNHDKNKSIIENNFTWNSTADSWRKLYE